MVVVVAAAAVEVPERNFPLHWTSFRYYYDFLALKDLLPSLYLAVAGLVREKGSKSKTVV